MVIDMYAYKVSKMQYMMCWYPMDNLMVMVVMIYAVMCSHKEEVIRKVRRALYGLMRPNQVYLAGFRACGYRRAVYWWQEFSFTKVAPWQIHPERHTGFTKANHDE